MRVAVIRGGSSLERSISIRSSARVTTALRNLNCQAEAMEADSQLVDRLEAFAPDFVFIAMHGKQGEDGTLQSLLELMGIPYVGSDALASALCINKWLFKEILIRSHIPTPAFCYLSSESLNSLGAGKLIGKAEQIGFPLLVKPACQGSSIGIKIVEQPEDLPQAILGALAYDEGLVLEKHITGKEVAVTVIQEGDKLSVLPVVEIVSENGFYSYAAHYEVGEAQLKHAKLSKNIQKEVEEKALMVFQLLGCRDFCRVDMICNRKPWILEINTIPGFTETGPTPKAAQLAGMSFEQLIEKLIIRASNM